MPPSHGPHWCAPISPAYMPALQELQRTLPSAPWLLPLVHPEHWVAPDCAYLPRAHLTQAVVVTLLLALPALHEVHAHVMSFVLRYLPVGHVASASEHVEHTGAPMAEKKPKAHGVHTASDVARVALEAVPAGQ